MNQSAWVHHQISGFVLMILGVVLNRPRPKCLLPRVPLSVEQSLALDFVKHCHCLNTLVEQPHVNFILTNNELSLDLGTGCQHSFLLIECNPVNKQLWSTAAGWLEYHLNLFSFFYEVVYSLGFWTMTVKLIWGKEKKKNYVYIYICLEFLKQAVTSINKTWPFITIEVGNLA